MLVRPSGTEPLVRVMVEAPTGDEAERGGGRPRRSRSSSSPADTAPAGRASDARSASRGRDPMSPEPPSDPYGDLQMSTTRGSRGDATRTMELLWGMAPQPTRGPKPGLTVDAVVDAAVALADAEGIDAVAMRRVADKLGVGAMSLYTYVPGKAELVDLMLDRVYGEQLAGIATEGGWRARLESVGPRRLGALRAAPVGGASRRPPAHPGPQRDRGVRGHVGRRRRHRPRRRRDGGGRDAVVRVRRGRRPRHRRGGGRGRDPGGRGRVVAAAQRGARPGPPPTPTSGSPCRAAWGPRGSSTGTPDEPHYLAGEIRRTFEFGLQRVLDGIEVLVAARRADRARLNDPGGRRPVD